MTQRLEERECELEQLRKDKKQQPSIQHQDRDAEEKKEKKERQKRKYYAIQRLEDFHRKLEEFLSNKEKLEAGLQYPDLFRQTITGLLAEAKLYISDDKS